MDSQTAYEIWAPRQSLWSVWAKPVLFAHLPRTRVELRPLPAPDVSWVPAAATERCAIVVDLPGAASVAMGLALADLGYQPVPLFNACPPPTRSPEGEWLGNTQVAIIDVDSILTALVEGCDRLQQIPLSDNAPPAFLIDAQRQQPMQPVSEGLFDNRSVVFITDFPSANFLAAQGIQNVLLVRQSRSGLAPDLAYTLRTWQTAGVELQIVALLETIQPQPLMLPPINWLTRWQARVSVWLGLRPNPFGGFGNFVPESSGG